MTYESRLPLRFKWTLAITLLAGPIMEQAIAAPDMNNPSHVLDLIKESLPQSCAGTTDLTLEDNGEPLTLTLRYDESRGQLWNLLAVNGEPATREQRKKLTPPPSLIPEGTGKLAALLRADFRMTSMDDELIVYHAEKLPRGTVRVDGVDVSRHMRAEMIVDVSGMRSPTLETHIIAKRPFRFRTLARVSEAVETRHFNIIEGRWLVPAKVDLTYSARMLGRLMEESEMRVFSNVSCRDTAGADG
ncbi:MAG: hypothetical protein AAF292_01365 [Pseudomonadota bacterium]